MLNIKKSLHSCLNCGSFFVQKNYFCKCCTDLIFYKLRADKAIILQTFKIYPLFYWRPGESDAFSQFILRMKESHAEIWEEYALRFLEVGRVVPKRSVLVSSESRSGLEHAQHWGESLSQLIGIPHIVGLRLKNLKAQSHEQKELSKLARKVREFEKIAEIPLEKRAVIFVDDVVTTGATALAAYKALGRPRNFQVWCLASRELGSIAET